MTGGTRWLPLKEAAEALGVSRDKLRGIRQRGKIEARKQGGQYLYAVPGDDAPVIDADEWGVLRELLATPAPPEREAQTIGGTYRVLSLFDVHVPEADAFAFRAVLDFARDTQPEHIVIGGDFLELESC